MDELWNRAELMPFLLDNLTPFHQLWTEVPHIGMSEMPIQRAIRASVGLGVGPLENRLIIRSRSALSDKAQPNDHRAVRDFGVRSSVTTTSQSPEGISSVDRIQVAPRHDGVFGGSMNGGTFGASGSRIVDVIVVPHDLRHGRRVLDFLMISSENSSSRVFFVGKPISEFGDVG